MDRIDWQSALDRADDAVTSALAMLAIEDDPEVKHRVLLRAGAWAAIATRLSASIAEMDTRALSSDNRTFRDGMLAGLQLAADMCRAHQDAPEVAGEYIEPGPLADEIARVAAHIGGASA